MIIDFNITNYCNAKCPTCKRFSYDNYLELAPKLKLIHMDFDEWKKIVETNLESFKNMTCLFCGEFGDPLMHPKIKDFAEVASQSFIDVSIYTNGGLKRPDLFKYLIETENNVRVRFGIDGLTHEINNKYRINVDTNLAFSNLKLLASYKKASWDYTIFEHNLHEVEQVINFALDNEISLHLRFNLRPSRFGVNRIRGKDVKRIEKLVKRYDVDIDQLEFDNFWVN